MIDNDLHGIAMALNAQDDANDLKLAVKHLIDRVRSLDSRLRVLEYRDAPRGVCITKSHWTGSDEES